MKISSGRSKYGCQISCSHQRLAVTMHRHLCLLYHALTATRLPLTSLISSWALSPLISDYPLPGIITPLSTRWELLTSASLLQPSSAAVFLVHGHSLESVLPCSADAGNLNVAQSCKELKAKWLHMCQPDSHWFLSEFFPIFRIVETQCDLAHGMLMESIKLKKQKNSSKKEASKAAISVGTMRPCRMKEFGAAGNKF